MSGSNLSTEFIEAIEDLLTHAAAHKDGGLDDLLAAPGNIGGTTPGNAEFVQLDGGVRIISSAGNITLTADQCRGAVVLITAAGTVILPAAADVIAGGVVTVYSTTAAEVNVDPDGADRIILDGTALDDGDKLTSASAAGDHVTLVRDGASGWTTLGRSGVWTDGG